MFLSFIPRLLSASAFRSREFRSQPSTRVCEHVLSSTVSVLPLTQRGPTGDGILDPPP